jgi:hypothetical protein
MSAPQVVQPASSAYTLRKKFGGSFSAPDQALCVGNGYVVEVVNMYLSVRLANGSTSAPPLAEVCVLATAGQLPRTSRATRPR